jgi:hypothetical protein
VGMAAGLVALAVTTQAAAQQPPPPQPQPQQPLPQLPPQPQPYQPPPQAQPYPPQPQPQPYQPAPQPQPYQPPPQAQPYPPQPQPQPYVPPPQGGPPPQYGNPPPHMPPPVDRSRRSDGEMAFLYGTSVAYGLGAGVWIDAVAGASDPAIAFIPPLALAAAAPIGVYLADSAYTFKRGVPSSIATGMVLGGIEGLGITTLNWQSTGNGTSSTWSFGTQASVTFLGATVGGIGGYIFGSYYNPDPRSLSFIASGAGWGVLIGTMFGAGLTPQRPVGAPSADWKDTASVAGFIGYNAGIVATTVLSPFYTPSWRSQQAMWIGFSGGAVASSLVYVFYIGNDSPVWHGLIANSVGALAGIGIAAAVTANWKDDDGGRQGKGKTFNPPVNIGFSPATRGGGGSLTASGLF